MTPEEMARVLARRRRAKQVLAGAVLAVVASLVGVFAFRSMWFIAAVGTAMLVASVAAAFVGRKPPTS